MKRTPLRHKSSKQKVKDARWNATTDEVAYEQNFTCQWCGKIGHRDKERYEDWHYLTGHHKIKRRFNIHTKAICYLVHLAPCHGEAENVDLEKYPTKALWERRESHESEQV